MIRTIKYQLDLNQTQKAYLAKCFGHTRFIYNYMLDKKIKAYQTDKTKLSCYDLCKELTPMKKLPEYIWLKEVTNESLQQSIRNMDSAFTRFFKEKEGFPKFKPKSGRQSCKFIQAIKVDFKNRKLKLPKIGWVRVFMDKEFGGKVGTVTITKNTAGKYFASICYNTGILLPTKVEIIESTTLGVDVGIKHFATLSTGEKIENPKFLEKLEQRLKVLQRRLSKKQKGSKRREAAKLRVAKLHYKIASQRDNFLHKLSSRLIRENQSVVIEDLAVKEMMSSKYLAKSIASVSWSEFFRQLKYKADSAGKNVITIGRFEPSSKMCSICNRVNSSLTLSDRHWTCLNCGTFHDRDINAAVNIKNIGLKIETGKAIPSEDVELLAVAGAMNRQDKKEVLC